MAAALNLGYGYLALYPGTDVAYGLDGTSVFPSVGCHHFCFRLAVIFHS